jgi:GrpB-like predicted nucleotidyltransferase (UPF0157 family)
VAGHEIFKTPEALPRHHLYVCRLGGVALRNHLAFRDHLRQFPQDMAAYATLKQTLAVASADVDEYTRKKTDFIISILSRYSFSEEELAAIRHANAG